MKYPQTNLDRLANTIEDMPYKDIRELAGDLLDNLKDSVTSDYKVHDLTQEDISELVAWWGVNRMELWRESVDETE